MRIADPRPTYKTFIIKKRNGDPRVIHAPKKHLKDIQHKLLDHFYKHAGLMKPCVHGFTPERSIVSNAQAHCSSKTKHLLNIDIENFFPSITFYRVRGLLQKSPFHFSYEVATVIAHICTFDGVLPQGAPTSPILANLICRSLDSDLMKLAKRHRATYTRYADDISFSFSVAHTNALPKNICAFDSGVLTIGEELKSIFKTNSFDINPNKSRLSTRFHRLEVTGITINKFPNIKRVFIDKIRGALHAWKKHGYDLAQAEWEKRVTETKNEPHEKRAWKRQWRNDIPPSLEKILRGKLLYVRMIRGKGDLIYLRLAKLYNELCARDKRSSKLPVDFIVRDKTHAEDAVFVIEWSGNYEKDGKSEAVMGQGTAFAYKNVGLITCDHVLRYCIGDVKTEFDSKEVTEATLELINPITQEKWKGKVAHRDAHRDLAIISFDSPMPPAHHHFVGMDAPIKEEEMGTLIGFPNYTKGKLAIFEQHSVLSRYPLFGLERFELKGGGVIRQGNSGGPFVNQKFQVAGVAQKGATQEGSNDECLCVSVLDTWIADLPNP
ncbi:MAG: reverse transcriptase domain-containing protein [Gallionella sp.]|nr:reverse transcriptase domain-containing protein [Gallionella sp.]